MSDYSATPLVKKLGLKAHMKVRFIHAPEEYFDLLSLPNIELIESGEVLADFVHIFAFEQVGLQELLSQVRSEIAQNGMIWISWQKKSSGIESNVNSNFIRSIALPLGLVDAKVCSINETWSALKVVIRKELRTK